MLSSEFASARKPESYSLLVGRKSLSMGGKYRLCLLDKCLVTQSTGESYLVRYQYTGKIEHVLHTGWNLPY